MELHWRGRVSAIGWLVLYAACGQGFVDTWQSVGDLSTRRATPSATELESGEVLVVGANDPARRTETEIYDPGLQTFRPGPTLSIGSVSHGAIRLLDGRVLISGGLDADGVRLLRTEIFDPVTETFQNAASQNFSTSPPILLANGDLVAAGEGIERYEVELDRWSVVQAPTPDGDELTWGVLARLPNDRILAVRRRSDGDRYFLYEPDLASDQPIAAPPSFVGTSLVLADGRLLFGALIYNPKRDEWSNATIQAVRDARKTLLPSGRVLFSGGRCGHPDQLCASNEVNIYDPETDEMVPAAPMAHERHLQTALRLSSGEILVIGGYDDTGESATTAEIYRE